MEHRLMGVWHGRRRVADTGVITGVGAAEAGVEQPRSRPRSRPRARPWVRPGRWAAVAVVTLILINVLVVGAYASSGFTPDNVGATGSTAGVPAAVTGGGAVVDTRGHRLATYAMPAKTIALTFDDGPDPTWTPRVLQVLAKHHVPATFFLIGSQASRYPGLVRDQVRGGNAVGIHTFTHPQMDRLPTWRQRLEIGQAQDAIAYAAGVRTSLLRLPYSSEVDAIDAPTWRVVRDAGDWGLVSVFSDTDSDDWARPGVPAIVRNATPAGSRGAIVLMHDAGGDRSQTVAALDRFIPEMQQRGYTFTTVPGGLNGALAGLSGDPASTGQAVRGGMLVWAVQIARWTVLTLWILLIVVGALTLARTLMLFGFAVAHTRRRRARTWSWGTLVTDPVTVIVPAYNECTTIAATVRSLASGTHAAAKGSGIEVLVVDDESSDGTADEVNRLGLPNVRVVRVPAGGKAAALNAGVALASHDLLVMVDADTVVEPDAIHELVQPFADARVGAVAGNVKVGNRRSIIGRWQHIEYVIGFNLDRRLYDTIGCMPTVPGALGAIRRDVVRQAGGVSGATLAEDTDLTMAVQRAGWQVVYQESAIARTEAPSTLRQLWAQRYRWSYGTMQAMWRHRSSMKENGVSRRFGRLGLPLIALFSIVLPLLGPVVDIFAVYGVFFVARVDAAIAWLAVMAVQALTAVLAFRLDREPLRPLWALPLQQLVYRQVMYLVLVHSTATALSGGMLKWQKLRRTGEVAAAQGSAQG
jgi:cellulose synthase/poly-beta-1,6-N-acetylglucosamine synthase-like glycosyltransferase/peptidoglycan/xylan/chitin deacetylase (PgdA/CDA1 family)